ncbi:MAG: glucose-1-phosphate thymidylyltransferase [Thermoanaerobaculum sp.]|nr:glucose-1-phosphate thymidylyltransferase [Thermoanaerobaculum sp.]
MKGLVLAGGFGTRLRPLTYTSAKQLVPVANKPVLFYGLEALAQAGVKEIGIVVGHTAHEIKEAVGDGSAWGVRVSYIPQDAPRGLAHAVLISEEFMGGEPFVMYLGDNLVKDGIVPFVREFAQGECNAQILLARVPNPSQFGVAELGPDGRVVRLEEKPKVPKSDLALVGVYLFDHHVFEAVKAIKPSARGELEITDAIQYLVEAGYVVRPHIITGWWKDTGKVEDMLEANRMVLDTKERTVEGEVDGESRVEGKAVIESGATVRRSVVRGPCIIGPGAVVEDSFIGPYTAIGPRCRIVACEVENSIILEGSELVQLPQRLEGCLIGKEVTVVRGNGRPQALRLVVGDHSRVEIP